ncbi:TIGR04222 domain-containing membrane protein [Streptomyces mobaraensis]|uniref:TIGR04222 domain-containing membrane protein n=1 Tax=Streptomyces mobaraensis TaxID=35621 RepID=A0A5N5W988_STRMB|nr:TIGR04222 domain-containing membrane protein [Streptomyces mobaraensis]KAB7844978.1 TIGR04222 domain-containing membrane protein [Streptomyces mobaraensis]
MIFLLLLTVLTVVAPSLWVLRLWYLGHGDVPPGTELDRFDLAYLTGGAGRVADTVITAMQQDGRVTVDGGRVTVVSAVSRDALERALLRHCGTDWARSLRKLRRDLREGPAVRDLHRSLVERGVLLRPDVQRWWPRAIGAQLPGLVLTGALALVMFRPASIAALALVGCGVTVRLLCRPEKTLMPFTAEGRRVALERIGAPPWDESDPARHPEGAAGVVAVGGTGALPDGRLRREFERAAKGERVPSRRSRNGRGRGSSSDSGTTAASSPSSSASSWSCGAVLVVGASCDSGTSRDSGGSAGHTGGLLCSSGSGCSSSGSSSDSSSGFSCSSGSSCSSSSCSSSSCSSSSCS